MPDCEWRRILWLREDLVVVDLAVEVSYERGTFSGFPSLEEPYAFEGGMLTMRGGKTYPVECDAERLNWGGAVWGATPRALAEAFPEAYDPAGWQGAPLSE